MNKLKNDIKLKKFSNTYLFFGDEDFLKKSYTDFLIKNLVTKENKMMNLDNFEGNKFSVESVQDALVTIPFMSPYRIVLIKKSGLFFTGRKNDSEEIYKSLESIPETSIIIFVEEKVDKRSKLYKYVSKKGSATEFTTPKEGELVVWIKGLFKRENKIINTETALYLLRTTVYSMENVYKEVLKLVGYKANSNNIEKHDIDEICTKAMETKIFDLVDAVGSKKLDIAIDIYNNLISLKEPPIMILALITRQFRLILQAKKLRETGASEYEISSILGIRTFVVKECLLQSVNFGEETLIQALKECLDIDIDIKTGKKADKMAVEVLILKYASVNTFYDSKSFYAKSPLKIG